MICLIRYLLLFFLHLFCQPNEMFSSKGFILFYFTQFILFKVIQRKKLARINGACTSGQQFILTLFIE